MCQTIKPHLPRTVEKRDLKDYFGCSYAYLWEVIITDDLLYRWGYNQDQIKPLRRLPPDLTRLIYVHFKITDLNADFVAEIVQEIAISAA